MRFIVMVCLLCLLLWVGPLTLEWQDAAPYWKSFFPRIGFLMQVSPGLWMLCLIYWLMMVKFFALRSRREKRKEQAEKQKAMSVPSPKASANKQAPVIEATEAPVAEVAVSEVCLASIEDASSVRVTQKAEAATAKAVVDKAIEGLEYSKLEAKVVCNGLSHSHGVVRLASFKKKFYLLDHKSRRIIKMLEAADLDAAKTEMLG